MEPIQLAEIISRGESSKVQFKERLPHQDTMAQEIVAFSNTSGGLIIIGVNDKTGILNGLSFSEIQQISTQLVTIADQQVFPSVNIETETVAVDSNTLIVVKVPEGLSKPYKDRNGTIYKKNGPDKRKVTSNDEISRLLQQARIMYADEMPVNGSSIDDINLTLFDSFIKKRYAKSMAELELPLPTLLSNLSLMEGTQLTLAGLLLFGKNRSKFRPLFSVQCISVNDIVVTGRNYADNEPAFDGTLQEILDSVLAFINRNLKKIPSGTSFNSFPIPEIPLEVFEELLVNALVHRDYFINSTIKVFILTDRIEIVSPGNLPNSLTVENILNGISIARNPILQSLAQYTMPYKGLGTGVRRAVALYPEISFNNAIDEQRFISTIWRK